MKHNKTGFKPSDFTELKHSKLKEKLNNPENGLRGYVELKEWIRKEIGKDIFIQNRSQLLCYKL